MKKRLSRTAWIIILSLIIVFIVAIATLMMSEFKISEFIAFIESFGPAAPIVFIVISIIVVAIAPTPSFPLDIAAGLIFGGFLGTVYSLIGSEIGAVLGFLIAKKIGRPFFEKKFKKMIETYDSPNEDRIAFLLFVSRLLPFVNFHLVNYIAGLTKISLWKFSVVTFFGMIPLTVLFAYSGDVLRFGNIWVNIAISLVVIALILFVPLLFNKKENRGLGGFKLI